MSEHKKVPKKVPIFTAKGKAEVEDREAKARNDQKPKSLREQFQEEIETAKNVYADKLWQSAFYYFELDEINQARGEFVRIIQLGSTPRLSSAHLCSGLCHVLERNYDKAIVDLTEAFTLKPTFEAYRNLELANAALGKTAESQQDHKTISKLPAADFVTQYGSEKFRKLMAGKYHNLACCERQGGNLSIALQYCTEAIVFEPSNPEHYRRRASIYDLSMDTQKAAQDREREEKLSPSPAEKLISEAHEMTRLIASFEDSASLNAHLQVSKEYRVLLKPLLDAKRTPFDQIEEEWNKLVQSQEMIQAFPDSTLELSLEVWLEKYLRNFSIRGIHVLWHATMKEMFALVRFLHDYGVKINQTYYPVDADSNWGESYKPYLRRGFLSAVFDPVNLLDSIAHQRPFPAEKVLFLISLEVGIKNEYTRKYILDGLNHLFSAENKKTITPESKRYRAGQQIVAFFLKERYIQKFEPLLQVLLANLQYQTHPSIHFIKAGCLLEHLNKLNVWHEKVFNSHASIISESIAKLEVLRGSNKKIEVKEIKKQLTHILEELNNCVKSDPRGKPSKLNTVLNDLKKQYPCLFDLGVSASHERKITFLERPPTQQRYSSSSVSSSSASSSNVGSSLEFFAPPSTSSSSITPSSSSSSSSSVSSTSDLSGDQLPAPPKG